MVNMILTPENWFLILLGIIWIIGAVLQDFKRREVDNLWNFSLIAIALAYRASVSVFNGNYWFMLNGLIGLGIFFIIGNIFYYSRMFAGGDAKLLMALGTILPLSYNWIINFKIFGLFILLFLIFGSFYSLVYAIVLMFVNFKKFTKEFIKQWKNYKKMFFIVLIFVGVWVVLMIVLDFMSFSLIGLVILLFPVLFVFAKSIEESCLVKEVNYDKITLGDWLYKPVKIKGRIIKADWEGLSSGELDLIRINKKKVWIKYGIPFTPSFLFGLIGLIYLVYRFGRVF
ncbi:MAG: prepilin peptidase [Nanoarchaeota archaeon]